MCRLNKGIRNQMFIRKNASSEIEDLMESHLITHAVEKKEEHLNKFAKAIDYLNSVAELFDEIGLTKEAEAATTFLEIVAAKKSKKKPAKSKTKTKTKSKPAVKSKKKNTTNNLSSEKMVDNLKEKGWMFNDTDDGHDDDCMCSMCMDQNFVSDKPNHGEDCACPKCDECMDANDNYEKDENEQDLARMFHDMMSEEDARAGEDLDMEGLFPNDEYGEMMHLKNRR